MSDTQSIIYTPQDFVGAERRQNFRYRLVSPMLGVVEHEHRRYPGRVIDMSLGGFQLLLPNYLSSQIAMSGRHDFGEVSHDGRFYGGFGRIVRVATSAAGLSVGFCWDQDIHPSHEANISRIIEYMVDGRKAGAVACDAAAVFLSGHISSALAPDALHLLSGGRDQVHLVGCRSIDSCGLDMLMGFQESGILVKSHSPEINGVLQRFHLAH